MVLLVIRNYFFFLGPSNNNDIKAVKEFLVGVKLDARNMYKNIFTLDGDTFEPVTDGPKTFTNFSLEETFIVIENVDLTPHRISAALAVSEMAAANGSLDAAEFTNRFIEDAESLHTTQSYIKTELVKTNIKLWKLFPPVTTTEIYTKLPTTKSTGMTNTTTMTTTVSSTSPQTQQNTELRSPPPPVTTSLQTLSSPSVTPFYPYPSITLTALLPTSPSISVTTLSPTTSPPSLTTLTFPLTSVTTSLPTSSSPPQRTLPPVISFISLKYPSLSLVPNLTTKRSSHFNQDISWLEPLLKVVSNEPVVTSAHRLSVLNPRDHVHLFNTSEYQEHLR